MRSTSGRRGEQETMRLKDKVCIITGAGSGMGRVATRMFCEQGALVVAADVNEGPGEETVAMARAVGAGDAIFVRANVAQERDCENLVDQSVVDTPVEAWDMVQDVNTKGIFLCCKYGIPAMVEAGGGSVINIASFV